LVTVQNILGEHKKKRKTKERKKNKSRSKRCLLVCAAENKTRENWIKSAPN
jgi:hypothetical protein